MFMIWWDTSFLILLESANITVRLYKRYVDDSNLKLPALAPGAIWEPVTCKV